MPADGHQAETERHPAEKRLGNRQYRQNFQGNRTSGSVRERSPSAGLRTLNRWRPAVDAGPPECRGKNRMLPGEKPGVDGADGAAPVGGVGDEPVGPSSGSLGGVLVGLRRRAGLSQERLAQLSGLSIRAISDLERGRTSRPQTHTVQVLLAALKATAAEKSAVLSLVRPGRCLPDGREHGAGAGMRVQVASDSQHDTACPAALTGAGRGLLDRDQQLAQLQAAAAAARLGQGRVVLVQADAGMGKTSLLNLWAELEQHQGMRLVWAGGSEMESGFAFAVARQLAEAVIGRAGQAGREHLLSGPAELARRIVEADADLPGADGAPDALAGLLHGLFWLMVHACDDGPLALLVDDVHWADPPSVRWLEYLARRVSGLPLLLVLAARPGSGEQVAPLLEQIAKAPGCLPVGLPALAAGSVQQLVQASLGPAQPGFVAACAKASGGNPLLLGELLRSLAGSVVQPADDQAQVVRQLGNRILAGTVVGQLAGLGEPARRLTQALVVLGDEPAWHVAAELAGLGEAQAREFGLALQRIGVLAPGQSVRFAHPLIRAAIAEAVLGPVELAEGHGRAAELLHRDGEPSAVVAAHLLLADPGGQPWRVDALRQAARVSRSQGSAESAVVYLRRALREPVPADQRAAVVLELGRDELQVDACAAWHHLAQAQAELTDPYSRAEAAIHLGASLYVGHEHDRALDALARAVQDLRHTDDGGTGIAREASWFLQAQMVVIGHDQLSTLPAARAHARRLFDYQLAGDTPGECAVLAALSNWAVTGGASAAVTNDLLERALRGGLSAIDPSQVLNTLAGGAFLATDRLDDAAARFEAVADAGRRLGSFPLISSAMTWQLLVHTRRGRQLPLTPDFGHPAAAGCDGLEPRVRLTLMTLVGESMLEGGDLPSATAALAPDADTDRVGWGWQGMAQLVRARLHAARGNPAAALALLQEYGAHMKRAQVTSVTLTPWRSQAAMLHLALGQRTDALALASEELELAHRWGTNRAIGVASRTLGTIQGGGEGKTLLREAVTLLEDSPARLELARAHFQLGAALARDGYADQARHCHTQALDLADSCGSRRLASQARQALTAQGVRPKPAPPAPPSLTLTEHRILELAHAGHTDRQIAQALLLTPHEVTALIEQTRRTRAMTASHHSAVGQALPPTSTRQTPP
ncbi:tetratricopeptide (TPR) repeat protein/DNA-binding XRE family transcriptional regulator [Catenulispora sp. GP43]|uniref:ATP-binding protein n=1 Tax=Catenulispora sp. GP43 TaxID=3156263 RepID=UPI003512AC77